MNGRNPTVANKRFAQLPGAVSYLSLGFIIYICHGDTLQLVSLAMLRISKASYTGNCANPNVVRNPIREMDKKQFEILESLPTYGPMYIPVTESGEQFYSEGFVVRLFKTDGESWVANFKPGWTRCNAVFHFPNTDKLVVIAGGLGYVMHPDNERPIETFGLTIDRFIKTEDNRIVATDGICVRLISDSGELWCSPRISWDGIKELKTEGNLVTGLSFDPMNEGDEWVPFSVDIDTKEVKGGSYRQYYTDNGQEIEKKK